MLSGTCLWESTAHHHLFTWTSVRPTLTPLSIQFVYLTPLSTICLPELSATYAYADSPEYSLFTWTSVRPTLPPLSTICLPELSATYADSPEYSLFTWTSVRPTLTPLSTVPRMFRTRESWTRIPFFVSSVTSSWEPRDTKYSLRPESGSSAVNLKMENKLIFFI